MPPATMKLHLLHKISLAHCMTQFSLHGQSAQARGLHASAGGKGRQQQCSSSVVACRVNILQTVMRGGLGSHDLQDLLAQQWSRPPRLRCGPMDATSFRHALPAHFVSLLRVQHACLRGCLKIMTWHLGQDGPGLKYKHNTDIMAGSDHSCPCASKPQQWPATSFKSIG